MSSSRACEECAACPASGYRHSHGLCNGPILINETNIRKWIPDMPEEYWRHKRLRSHCPPGPDRRKPRGGRAEASRAGAPGSGGQGSLEGRDEGGGVPRRLPYDAAKSDMIRYAAPSASGRGVRRPG